jgi:hypothetical protein
MGSSSSKESKAMQIRQQQELQEKALYNFNQRIASYSYPHHGPYDIYIQWCRAEYELECLPDSCRYGPAYREDQTFGSIY